MNVINKTIVTGMQTVWTLLKAICASASGDSLETENIVQVVTVSNYFKIRVQDTECNLLINPYGLDLNIPLRARL